MPPYISQLSIDPLLVLPLVRRQLLLSLGLRGLGSLPVPLEARPCFGLSLGPATCSPTALGLVVAEIGHGHRLCQRSGSEGLYLLRPHEGGGPEGRRPATRGKKTLQGRNLRVQLLRAPQSLCLPVLAVALGSSPLVGPRLPLLLSPPSGFGFQLALLLPLHFSPDTDKTSRTTTHVLRALPGTLAAERHLVVPTTSCNEMTLASNRRPAHPLTKGSSIGPSPQVNVTGG